MSCIRSEIFGGGVSHGFGMAGYSLTDYCKGMFFWTNQMHGDCIVRLSKDTPRNKLFEADAFITNEPGLICHVRTADCVPILLHDPVKNVVGAVHSGWRGTALNIAVKTLERFESEFGSKREDIRAAIGPSISGSCYEVGEEVFQGLGLASKGKGLLDLQGIIFDRLRDGGLKHIDRISICNHCDERFASYRRDRSEAQRQVNFISITQ